MGVIKSWYDIIFDRVKKTENINDCWEWTSTKDKDGYGKFVRKIPGTRKHTYHRAHREVFKLINDCILSNDQLVCHTCDNPSCCNPNHLFLGTAKDNMRDMVNKNRKRTPKGKDHWINKKTVIRDSSGRFKTK